MRRTDLQDTALWAHRAMIERLRELPDLKRFRMIFDRIEARRQIQAAGRRHFEKR